MDDETLMLHNFVYDGNGKDTFFWAGSSNRPSSKGFIVPDKDGRTNVLGRCGVFTRSVRQSVILLTLQVSQRGLYTQTAKSEEDPRSQVVFSL